MSENGINGLFRNYAVIYFLLKIVVQFIVVFGLFEGGYPGARGLNLLVRADGKTINLGPKTAVPVGTGVS